MPNNKRKNRSNIYTRTYKFKVDPNKSKLNKIYDLLKEWRLIGDVLVDKHMKYLYQNGMLCTMSNVKNSHLIYRKLGRLSNRQLTDLNGQVLTMIESKLSNFQTTFRNKINKHFIPKEALKNNTNWYLKENESLLTDLYIINKYQWWFHKGDKTLNSGYVITSDRFQTARWIFKRYIGKLPSCENINIKQTDQICKIEDIKTVSTDMFTKVLNLSSLENRKTIKIPVIRNKHVEQLIVSNQMVQTKSSELIFKNNKLHSICFSYDLPNPTLNTNNQNVTLGFDIGLNHFIALSTGELYGERMMKEIKRKDRLIIACQNKLKEKHGDHVKLSEYEEYTTKIHDLQAYIKNEVGRIMNIIISKHNPTNIVMEDLNFQNSELSPTMNRLLNGFGLGVLKRKLGMLTQSEGLIVHTIDPAYTSQTCSKCKYVDSKNRNKEKFKCKCCGYKSHADINASRNMEWFFKRFGGQTFHTQFSRQNKRKELTELFKTNILNNKSRFFWTGNYCVTQLLRLNI